MRKGFLFIVVACAALTACGMGGEGNGTADGPPPLYENPPFGASDIDATVEETRQRMDRPDASSDRLDNRTD